MRALAYLALPLFLLFACGETSTSNPTPDETAEESTEETTTDNDTTDGVTDTSETGDDPEGNSIQDQVEMTAERAHAMEIGLSVIQSYFDGNAEVFINLLADTLPQIGREGDPMDGEYFRDLVRNSSPYPAGEDFTGYTMQQYEEVFEPLVLTYDEAVELIDFPVVEGSGWIPESADFLFLGWNLKPGQVESDKFIRDGLNSFVFGIRDGEWKFVGFIS